MKHVDIDAYRGITMEEFLNNFVGVIPFEQVERLKRVRATHQDITMLGIPYIERVPFGMVTEWDIMTGNILLVSDFKSTEKRKRLAPYIRPELLKKQKINKERRKVYGKF